MPRDLRHVQDPLGRASTARAWDMAPGRLLLSNLLTTRHAHVSVQLELHNTNPRVRKRVKLEATKPQTLEIWKLSEEPSHDDAPARLFAFCCLVVFFISPATNGQEEDTKRQPQGLCLSHQFLLYCPLLP